MACPGFPSSRKDRIDHESERGVSSSGVSCKSFDLRGTCDHHGTVAAAKLDLQCPTRGLAGLRVIRTRDQLGAVQAASEL